MKKKTALKELCHEIQPNQEITKCSLNQQKQKKPFKTLKEG